MPVLVPKRPLLWLTGPNVNQSFLTTFMRKTHGTMVGECPKCNAPIGDKHPYAWCIDCGEGLPKEVRDLVPVLAEKDRVASLTPTEQTAKQREIESKIQGILLTTAPTLDGYRVTETLDVITAECVLGMNIFKDIMAGLSDVFGGRSETTEKSLRDARITCLYALRKEADALGANAVIAVDLDYSEFSGGGKSMLFLVASGTAVKVERVQ